MPINPAMTSREMLLEIVSDLGTAAEKAAEEVPAPDGTRDGDLQSAFGGSQVVFINQLRDHLDRSITNRYLSSAR